LNQKGTVMEDTIEGIILDRMIDHLWKIWDADYLHIENVEVMEGLYLLEGQMEKQNRQIHFRCECSIEEFC